MLCWLPLFISVFQAARRNGTRSAAGSEPTLARWLTCPVRKFSSTFPASKVSKWRIAFVCSVSRWCNQSALLWETHFCIFNVVILSIFACNDTKTYFSLACLQYGPLALWRSDKVGHRCFYFFVNTQYPCHWYLKAGIYFNFIGF